MNTRLLLLLLLASVSLQFSTAHALTRISPPAGEILQSGICIESGGGSRYDQPQSTAGYATMGDVVITEKVTDVPLKKGIGFGFSWTAHNLPQSPVVTYRVEHPNITRPDGITLDHFEEDVPKESIDGVLHGVDCYFLSEDHELAPGTWTLSIFFKGTLLVKQSFHVTSGAKP